MVKIIRKFPEKSSGRPPIYDWPAIFDGRVRELQQGVDFEIPVGTFRNSVYSAASRAGWVVRVAVDGDTVTIQRTGKA